MRREPKIAKRQTASDYLKKLMEIGVLIENQAGREKLFIHAALFDLLRGRRMNKIDVSKTFNILI